MKLKIHEGLQIEGQFTALPMGIPNLLSLETTENKPGLKYAEKPPYQQY